jgi:hypothetical protein
MGSGSLPVLKFLLNNWTGDGDGDDEGDDESNLAAAAISCRYYKIVLYLLRERPVWFTSEAYVLAATEGDLYMVKLLHHNGISIGDRAREVMFKSLETTNGIPLAQWIYDNNQPTTMCYINDDVDYYIHNLSLEAIKWLAEIGFELIYSNDKIWVYANDWRKLDYLWRLAPDAFDLDELQHIYTQCIDDATEDNLKDLALEIEQRKNESYM